MQKTVGAKATPVGAEQDRMGRNTSFSRERVWHVSCRSPFFWHDEVGHRTIPILAGKKPFIRVAYRDCSAHEMSGSIYENPTQAWAANISNGKSAD